jgi:hypothetical protein
VLTLRVRGGELEAEPWVYAWLAPHGVVYVGATALHPATRTWLHLHDEDPNIGRMRDRYSELTGEELDVLALQLPPDVDRQQVRHGAVSLLAERGLLSERHVCDPPLPAEPTRQADELVAAVEERLRG